MKNSIVRIESVEIKNFKNVKYGFISFENSKKDFAASILGLYGQNGSGKTALVDAIAMLKFALAGQPLPTQCADYINVEASSAALKYEFKVTNKANGASYTVFYEFSIRKAVNDVERNAEQANMTPVDYKTAIYDEVLSYSYDNSNLKVKLLPIVDTRTDGVFSPATKYNVLVGKGKKAFTDLMVAKQYAAATSRSFVFSKELLNVIRLNCKEEYHRFLFESLVFFGNFELFVINTANAGLISMNALPLAFNYEENNQSSIGSLMINLNEPSLIPDSAVDVVEKVIKSMNIVLTQLVPGLTVGIKKLGTELFQNGGSGCRIQLVSNKNSKEIPLKYESDGIKKIISVLQLLITIYNRPSMTVAIDELDSGVFEYLLGEILRIISEKGKGQLVFTSHNLRPLETLDKGFIAFTTTNPQNRYLRLSNVKTSNNLRDFYYRDIVLGEQNEPVYEPTNNYEIALAFREAGDTSAS